MPRAEIDFNLLGSTAAAIKAFDAAGDLPQAEANALRTASTGLVSEINSGKPGAQELVVPLLAVARRLTGVKAHTEEASAAVITALVVASGQPDKPERLAQAGELALKLAATRAADGRPLDGVSMCERVLRSTPHDTELHHKACMTLIRIGAEACDVQQADLAAPRQAGVLLSRRSPANSQLQEVASMLLAVELSTATSTRQLLASNDYQDIGTALAQDRQRRLAPATRVANAVSQFAARFD